MALGISRASYYSAKKERASSSKLKIEEEILLKIKEIKEKHPFWGYRRVTAWIRRREKRRVNHKKVYRIMKLKDLLCDRKFYKAKRKATSAKPKAERPLQYWGIDMTKFSVRSVGWVYLVVVLDWYTRKIVGRNLSLRSRASEWKEALDMALNREFPEGVRGRGLKLVSDNGPQPTSRSFMQDMASLGIEQIFTSYSNPKGNAETERVMRTIKEEVLWLNEFESLAEAKEKLQKWIEIDYNKLYVHSELGYRSPEEFEAMYYEQAISEVA